jgi:hypothetical protein
MKIVAALKDRAELARVLDPNHPRLVTGTPEEQAQARRQWMRQRFISQVVNSDLREIPRSELAFKKRGIIEHVASPDGDWYVPVRGNVDLMYANDAIAYYVTASEDVVVLERAPGRVTSRRAYEEHLAEQEARRNAPKPRPAWMRDA